MKADGKSDGATPTQSRLLLVPDQQLPFNIINEGTRKRWLPDVDFDVEPMQIIGDAFCRGG